MKMQNSSKKNKGIKEFGVEGLYSNPKNPASTGEWRVEAPVIDYQKCTNCLTCFMYCPEGAIQVSEEGKVEINYSFCKGCGVCANECPVKAIKFVSEKELVKK